MQFIGQRLVQLLPVLWGVGSIVFLLLHLVPGDPVEIMLGESALQANKQAMRESLGLDRPISEQYISFWRNALTGNLGSSFASKRPVMELIRERIGATLALAILAFITAIVISIPIGTFAAAKANSFRDNTILLASVIAACMPSFWLAPLLVLVFSVKFNWLPVSERGGPESYILPVATLSLGMSAVLIRMVRSSVVEALRQDFITIARAKGLSETTIYFKHGLKNALIPVITLLGLQLGGLLAGTVIIETIFDWPGVGELTFRAIQSRDIPLVQGCVLCIAVTYVLANLIADLAYNWANPRSGTE